jgi:hypothetical protein
VRERLLCECALGSHGRDSFGIKVSYKKVSRAGRAVCGKANNIFF